MKKKTINKKSLIKRIQNSVFLTGEEIEHFVACVENAPASEYKKVSKILDDAEKKQNKMIDNINKNNPNFNNELNSYLLKIYNQNIESLLTKNKKQSS